MKQEEKTATITFRTTESLKNSLEAMAAKDMRTLTNLIEVILTKAVEADKKKK